MRNPLASNLYQVLGRQRAHRLVINAHIICIEIRKPSIDQHERHILPADSIQH